MQKGIFISHITEETEVATRLKGMIATDFLGLAESFVSSAPPGLPESQRYSHP